MKFSKLVSAASVALLFSFTSCASAPEPVWIEGEAQSASRRVLIEVTRIAIEREGFPVIAPGFDTGTSTIKSGWRTDLIPLTGQRTRGFRERAWVKFSTGEDGELDLKVRVERQRNKNLARPLDPKYADWEDGPDSLKRARFLLQVIKGSLHVGGSA